MKIDPFSPVLHSCYHDLAYRSMLVVGPDRVGKTTLVQHLSSMTGLPSFKCPSEKEIFKTGGSETLTFDYMLTHFLDQTGYNFISDRSYPCEFVYSRVFNRKTNDALLKSIDYKHASLGTVIVYVYSADEPEEEDDLVPPGMYGQIKNGYDIFCSQTKCKVIRIETSQMLAAYKTGLDVSLEFASKIILEVLKS